MSDATRSSRRRLHRRTTVLLILFVGLLVLGIGCVCWAVMNICAQSSRVVSDKTVPAVATTRSVETTRSVAPVAFQEGDTVGTLSIPALGKKFPIIEGTGEDDLKKGVGHYIQSVLPGINDNCVLSGHRDTIFAGLGKLKIGNRLVVRTVTGTFTYKISGTRIVDKDDRTVIVPTDHAVLTLTTCYPFHFVGSAPDRYIISSDLVKSE
ncbi:MAG: class D sortase [Coriobacteriia bacterium]|nr:class D sortase [Coriobacteriia bacterium]